MKNTTPELSCDCPMECNTLSYSFSIVTTPFDGEVLCPELMTKYDLEDNFLLKPFYDMYDSGSPPEFVRKLLKIKNNVSYDPMEYCKKHLEYRAEVNFKLVTDTMSVTVLSRRLSFFDKMSAFGEIHIYLTDK